jgi:hypothetical protein
MRIVFISPKADATTDIHNSDATLRGNPIHQMPGLNT